MKVIMMVIAMTLSSLAAAEVTAKSDSTQLDDLIRGELAAVKSYEQVLADLKGTAERKKLETIRKKHKDNVVTLKSYAPMEFKDEAGGLWSGVTQAYTGSAKLISKETAIKALTQGEEHGVNEYEEALQDDSLPAELRAKIKNELIPQQRDNIKSLKTLL